MNKIILLFLLLPFAANAALINLSGNFSGANLGTASSVDQISGTWNLTYDDSGISADGIYFHDVELTAFSLDPNPLGATIFDLTNTVAQLVFSNSNLRFIVLGGVNNGVNSVFHDTDDFIAAYNAGATSLTDLAQSLASESLFATSANEFSGEFTSSSQVPEPATFALFGLGLAGLGFARRKKSS